MFCRGSVWGVSNDNAHSGKHSKQTVWPSQDQLLLVRCRWNLWESVGHFLSALRLWSIMTRCSSLVCVSEDLLNSIFERKKGEMENQIMYSCLYAVQFTDIYKLMWQNLNQWYFSRIWDDEIICNLNVLADIRLLKITFSLCHQKYKYMVKNKFHLIR